MESRLVAAAARRPAASYGVAVLCAIGGLLIRLPLNPILQARVPYITFFLATAVSATYGGFGPGLVTTVLGAVFASYYVPSMGSLVLGSADNLGLAIFLGVSSFISYLAGKLLEARQHENALRILFQQTFISIGDAVITTDDNRAVRLMNPVAEQLTGWTEADARGKPIEQVFQIFKEGSDEPAEVPIDRILNSGQVVGVANHSELRTKDGSRIPIDDSGAPIRDVTGHVVGVVLVFRGITERRRTEKALEALNEELRQFTHAASHDIREPIRTIGIFTELIQNDPANPPGARNSAHLARVHNAAQHLSHLIESLLQFTTLRDAETFIPSSPVDVHGALEEVKRNLELVISEAQASITFEDLPSVNANFVHVCQLLQNLIANAVKYRRQGVAPVIHISGKRSGKQYVVAVKDNGVGIAPEHLTEVFVPFKRFHGAEIEGVGIGLAICKRIVQRYGGQIWVTSNDGPGSTFFFSLPAAEVSGSDRQ